MHYWRLKHHGDPFYVKIKTVATCKASGCAKTCVALGYCGMHYQRFSKGADMDAPPRKTYDKVCSVPGCGLPHAAYGYCCAHGCRFKSRGTTDLAEKGMPIGTEALRSFTRPFRQEWYVKLPSHPLASRRGWVRKSLCVLEAAGIPVHKRTRVIPVDGDYKNHALSNLIVGCTARIVSCRVCGASIVRPLHQRTRYVSVCSSACRNLLNSTRTASIPL